MTEQEAFESLSNENKACFENCDGSCWTINNGVCSCRDGLIVSAIEELKQYRTIGTLDEYKETVKQLETAKEVIKKLLCSEYGSSCQFCIHDEDKDAMCCHVGGSGSWCCENAKWNGRLE